MPIYINKNGQQSGPYEDHVVTDQLRAGMLSPDDLGIRHGESSWQRLGDIFPGVGKSKVVPPIDVAAPAAKVMSATPSPKKGGCLKAGLIATGLILLFLGIGTAVGSRFIPSVSCELAESDARKIDKLKADLDKATKEGDFDEIGPLELELQEELSGAMVTQQYCNDDKFRDNLIGAAGGGVGFVGFLMALVGLFVGRRK